MQHNNNNADNACLVLFERTNAQRAFVNAVHLNYISTHVIDPTRLLPVEHDLVNLALDMHVHVPTGTLLYTAIIDIQDVTGAARHDATHARMHLLKSCARRVIPDITTTLAITPCNYAFRTLSERLVPIPFTRQQHRNICAAMDITIDEEEDNATARNQDQGPPNPIAVPRTRAQIRAVRRENMRRAMHEADRGIVTNPRPTRRARTHANIQQPHGNEERGGDPIILGHRIIRPENTALEILLGPSLRFIPSMDLSRPGPTEALAETPEKQEGVSLSDDWESLLKPKEELHKPVEDRYKCETCLTFEKSIIVMPCRHQFYCDECFRKAMTSTTLHKTCPVCRKNVTGIVRAY